MIGHCVNECSSVENDCYNCGKTGNLIADCKGIIDTPSTGSVTTSLVCLKRRLTIYGKRFVMDLTCL